MSTAEYHVLAGRRWRVAIVLTLLVVIIYFGFIALIAYDKEAMGRLLAPGLSLGILLGALVIVSSWLLTWFYVRWANRTWDSALASLKSRDSVERGR
jgi:uncharacterized membrane protein (DUF485 family)